MPNDADLSLPALATTLAEFVTGLELRQVTVVCNEWGGAQLLISLGGTDRVANLVLISCKTLDSYPPGRPGQLLSATAAPPGGSFLVTQLFDPRWIHRCAYVTLEIGNQ